MNNNNDGATDEKQFRKGNEFKNVFIQNGEDMNDLGKYALSDYEHFRITDSTPIPEPVPIVSINGEIISTEGNITTISGASKSGKSAFASFILAGAISKDGIINDSLPGLFIEPNHKGFAVLHFDTEQARHKHQKNLKGILRRADMNNCPNYFLSYNIRELDINSYEEVTANICQAAQSKFGGIHLIIIDGIADYISDVNDPVESNAIVKSFEELAIKYRTPLITIVHTNPGGDKERGHLGSQCQRKSESVLSIKTEGDVAYLEPRFLRMAGKGDIPPLQFRYDKEKFYHVGCGIRTCENDNKDADRVATIEKICQKVFAIPAAYGYKDAIDKIMKEANKAETTAKGFFREMKAHEMIIQGQDKNWRLFTHQMGEIEVKDNELG